MDTCDSDVPVVGVRSYYDPVRSPGGLRMKPEKPTIPLFSKPRRPCR